MAQRGRKSQAALSIAPPPVELCPRAQPPAELTDLQASIWQRVVSTKPAEWFQADTQALLTAYCKHVATAAIVDQQVDAFDPEWLKDDDGLGRFKLLTELREKQTRAINALSRSMRLTQQSRYDAQKAHSRSGKVTRKPWDG